MLEFKFLGVPQVSLGVRLHTFSRVTVNFIQSSSDSESGKIKQVFYVTVSEATQTAAKPFKESGFPLRVLAYKSCLFYFRNIIVAPSKTTHKKPTATVSVLCACNGLGQCKERGVDRKLMKRKDRKKPKQVGLITTNNSLLARLCLLGVHR